MTTQCLVIAFLGLWVGTRDMYFWRSPFLEVSVFFACGTGGSERPNGDGNIGDEAEQQVLSKIDKVHTPWPLSH